MAAVIESGPGLDNSSSEQMPPLLGSDDLVRLARLPLPPPPPPSPPVLSLKKFLRLARLPPPPPPPLPSVSTSNKRRGLPWGVVRLRIIRRRWALKNRPSLYEDYWLSRVIRKPTRPQIICTKKNK